MVVFIWDKKMSKTKKKGRNENVRWVRERQDDSIVTTWKSPKPIYAPKTHRRNPPLVLCSRMTRICTANSPGSIRVLCFFTLASERSLSLCVWRTHDNPNDDVAGAFWWSIADRHEMQLFSFNPPWHSTICNYFQSHFFYFIYQFIFPWTNLKNNFLQLQKFAIEDV